MQNAGLRTLESLGLTPEQTAALPDGLRRRIARFLIRWQPVPQLLPLLPTRDHSPRDRFDRCRALLAAGQMDAARDLARDLVNMPEGRHWGHRAVGEVFLAMQKADRADERFRAGADPIGRARAWLMLGKPAAALDFLRESQADDPEAETVRLEALQQLGQDTREVERRLFELLEEERTSLLEAVGVEEVLGPPPTDPEGLREALKRVFDYDEFRPGQLETMLPLMRGESVLGLMPTGAGKSICFQLPAALLPGATVVISPLIALMKDQVDGLPPALYRRATLINSGLEPGEADRRMEAIARGEISLIYAAPERLRQRTFVRALQRCGVSLFVVDEAHCVSLWGHDFRPDYFFIRQVLRDLDRPTVLALTATATPEMQADIGRQLDMPLQRVNLGTFRPNLQLAALRMPSEVEKWSTLLSLVREEKGATIIYVDRRKLAEELSEKLRKEGVAAEAYHAGMERGARDRTQSRFMAGEIRVMAATVAFGMGVDKADVRLVVHYNLPRSLEAYYQEAGRAGRDGLPARCVLLYTSYDKSNLTRRTNQDRMQDKEFLLLYRTLARRLQAGPGCVPVEELVGTAAPDETRLRVGISLLQDIGALERGYDVPLAVWLAIRNGVDLARVPEPLRRLVEGGVIATIAGVVPAMKLASVSGLPLDALEPALLEWQESGWIRFRTNGRGMGLGLAAGWGAAGGMSGEQIEAEIRRVAEHAQHLDTRRLELLAHYLASQECRQGFVSRYFGLDLPQGCGVCDSCRLAGSRRAAPAAATVPDRIKERPNTYQGPQSDEESALFERLRAWRRGKAREEEVPAHVIFHDRVLYAIASARPTTLAALAEVPGIGRAKLQAHGDDVLEVVRRFERVGAGRD